MAGNRIKTILSRMEQSLEAIDNPRVARNDALGQGRTLGNNSKVRELENLVIRCGEIQELILSDGQNETQQERLRRLKVRLAERIDLVFANAPNRDLIAMA